MDNGNLHNDYDNELDNSLLYNNEFFRKMSMPEGPQLHKYTNNELDYIKTLIILLANNHSWRHKPSCFKKSKRTPFCSKSICRYLFPKNVVEKTEFDGIKMLYRRDVGPVYINSYNETLSLAMRCKLIYKV